MVPIVLLLLAASTSAFQDNVDRDVGEKLILTPYIKARKIGEARKLARVPPLGGSPVSYSGFVTVHEKCNSNLFFWYFCAEENPERAPVAVWLQGGPGATSLYGLFTEIGPYNLTADYKLRMAEYPWTRLANVLFIDSPVGTGFSYTGHASCYAKNEVMLGKDLRSAVKQVLRLFPEVASNPLFVVGESYAGKFVPALGYAILKDRNAKEKINLQGLAIGNGIVDPANQFKFSEQLHQLGLLDEFGSDAFKELETRCQVLISLKMWASAALCFDQLLGGKIWSYPTLFTNLTGLDYYYNFLHQHQPPEFDPAVYMTQNHIRKIIHVGNATWNTEGTVQKFMIEDIAQSVRPWLEELVETYRVLIYTGQLDIIVSYPMVVNYIKNMRWSGMVEYKNTPRVIWKVDGEVAGYAKTVRKLTEVLVRNAGHLVPTDQPKWAFDMISRFFNDEPFN